jgi:hypothetical protein
VGGVQVIRRADREVVGPVARPAEEVLELGAVGEEPRGPSGSWPASRFGVLDAVRVSTDSARSGDDGQ